ncbi:uncharacterized protein LTR77_001766 [Saxophila tyrrhenica]|uniref:Uncharacterized protein n=1 Tax=Saxophila tyrrhenica TaxID=1690608 RepID=A0AAV9PPK7_9PEZI|nr:hypothetical protein LTR77_001766 [Saxophila tyrrhenica]
MGTLTADQTRLPEYCEHKLPTSCRLTSIPNCCACADERAHSASYSTYIDGIGFVPRGNRWQRYCWFCKEFWQRRVEVSGLRPGQTRIPEVPDQTDFLKKWYEFHEGYRTVEKEDGSEERVAVLGEPFRDVSPGDLPRTVEEMREGRRRGEEVQQSRQTYTPPEEPSGPSLDDTLEQMFEDASLEEAATPTEPAVRAPQPSQDRNMPIRMPSDHPLRHNIHAQAMNPAASRNAEYSLRRVTALRRELNRMRRGIERLVSGLREFGEDVPGSVESETTESLLALGETLDNIAPLPEQVGQPVDSGNAGTQSAGQGAGGQSRPDRTLTGAQSRVEEARAQVDEARHARDHAASEFDHAETEFRSSQQRLQQLQREQRTAENYMRLFGTREEIIAQGENYESPIGGMFTRAEERFRAAEEARAEERTLREVLAAEAAAGGEEESRRLADLEARERDLWGVPWRQAARDNALDAPPHLAPTSDETMLQEYYAMLRSQDRIPQSETQNDGNAVTLEEAAAAGAPTDNFPHSMLNAIRAARVREVTERETSPLLGGEPDEGDAEDAPHSVWPLDAWFAKDLEYVLACLAEDEELRRDLWTSPQDLRAVLDAIRGGDLDMVDDAIHNMVSDPANFWRLRLPAEWLRRRRAIAGDSATVTADLLLRTGGRGYPVQEWVDKYNPYLTLEILAQTYQMSAQVRRRAEHLSPPERLQVLYRLQAGQRTEEDIAVLQSMRESPEIWELSMTTYASTLPLNNRDSQAGEQHPDQHNLDTQRRAQARDGNHSRTELDSRRRETAQAFALAAGRQAMQTGSDNLIAQQAARDATTTTTNEEGTHAAFRRLQANNFMGRPPRIYRQLTLSDYLNEGGDSGTSSSEEEAEPEAQGLDAADSGRPEPKEDAELKVQMECKRAAFPGSAA